MAVRAPNGPFKIQKTLPSSSLQGSLSPRPPRQAHSAARDDYGNLFGGLLPKVCDYGMAFEGPPELLETRTKSEKRTRNHDPTRSRENHQNNSFRHASRPPVKCTLGKSNVSSGKHIDNQTNRQRNRTRSRQTESADDEQKTLKSDTRNL